MNGYPTAGNLAGSAEAQRQPDVFAHTERIGRALASLEESANLLVNRLSAVQRPVPPTPANTGKDGPHEVMCPMAEQLRGFASQIDRLSMLLEENRARLEI